MKKLVIGSFVAIGVISVIAGLKQSIESEVQLMNYKSYHTGWSDGWDKAQDYYLRQMDDLRKTYEELLRQ